MLRYAAFALLACHAPDDRESEPFSAEVVGFPSPSFYPPLVGQVSLAPHPEHPLLLVLDVVCTVPCELAYTLEGDGVEARTAGPFAPSGTHRQVVAGLREASEYRVDVHLRASRGRAVFGSAVASTGPLPAWIPEVRVEVPGDPGGVFLVGLREDVTSGLGAEALFLAIDAEGHVIWYHFDPARSAELPLIRRRTDGTFFLTYAGRTEIIDIEGAPVLAIGQRVEDDDWHHDRLELPDGNHLVQGFELRTVNNGLGRVEVLGDTVLEYGPDGRIRNRWSALDTMDINRFPTPLSKERLKGGFDWTHGNALELTPDGAGYLVSLRHQHWIIRVDRRTQRIDWRLGTDGDFVLRSGTWFDAQHAPRFVGSDRLLVYDNGVERHRVGGATSRVVRYRLDEGAKTAAQEWAWDLPMYTPIVGDVHAWRDGVIVTAGGRQDGTSSVWWVGEDGEVRWELAIESFAFRGEVVEAL